MIARLLISSNLKSRVEEINKILASNLNKVNNFQNHPDLLYFSSDSKLGIEQARAIKNHFSLKPFQADGRIVVIEDASNLTHDAQNALLKTFEELPTENILILGASSEHKFLPTVLSRCEIVRIKDQGSGIKNEKQEDIEKLISATLEERFEFIEKLKDKEEFLNSLVLYFHKNLLLYEKNKQFIEELLVAEQFKNQNVNIRAILEYLMLVMPMKV